MDGVARSTASDRSSAGPEDAKEGFRQLRVASTVGLLGQLLIWGCALALWVVGSLYSTIPVQTKITYGANGILVSAGAIFALNYLLIAGAAVALLALCLTARGLQKIARAPVPLNLGEAVSLSTIGAIGLGMFALGWAIWLGSFVAPGSSAPGNPSDYTSVMDSNLAVVVDFMLFVGGLLAFLGMLGIALASSKVGTTYEEGAIELGGALSMVPVFSIMGYAFSLVGLLRGERKLRSGWIPPPPPPVPTYPSMIYRAGYPGGSPIVVSGQPGSWDRVATVLVVLLVLLWVFILPISLLISSESLTKGPSNTPVGGGNSSAPAASNGSSSLAVFVLVGLAATAVLLPIAIVRNRRKRQRPVNPPVAPPPPPPAPDEDPLDHLV